MSGGQPKKYYTANKAKGVRSGGVVLPSSYGRSSGQRGGRTGRFRGRGGFVSRGGRGGRGGGSEGTFGRDSPIREEHDPNQGGTGQVRDFRGRSPFPMRHTPDTSMRPRGIEEDQPFVQQELFPENQQQQGYQPQPTFEGRDQRRRGSNDGYNYGQRHGSNNRNHPPSGGYAQGGEYGQYQNNPPDEEEENHNYDEGSERYPIHPSHHHGGPSHRGGPSHPQQYGPPPYYHHQPQKLPVEEFSMPIFLSKRNIHSEYSNVQLPNGKPNTPYREFDSFFPHRTLKQILRTRQHFKYASDAHPEHLGILNEYHTFFKLDHRQISRTFYSYPCEIYKCLDAKSGEIRVLVQMEYPPDFNNPRPAEMNPYPPHSELYPHHSNFYQIDQNELHLWTSIDRNPYSVRLYDVFDVNNSHICFVYDYVLAGENAKTYYYAWQGGRKQAYVTPMGFDLTQVVITEEQAWRFILQLLVALRNIHEKGLIYYVMNESKIIFNPNLRQQIQLSSCGIFNLLFGRHIRIKRIIEFVAKYKKSKMNKQSPTERTAPTDRGNTPFSPLLETEFPPPPTSPTVSKYRSSKVTNNSNGYHGSSTTTPIDFRDIEVTAEEMSKVTDEDLRTIDLHRLGWDERDFVWGEQRNDLRHLGRVIVNLCMNDHDAYNKDREHACFHAMSKRGYSDDLLKFVGMLINGSGGYKEIFSACSGKLWMEMSAVQSYQLQMENQLELALENGRLMRLMTKLNYVVVRLKRGGRNLDFLAQKKYVEMAGKGMKGGHHRGGQRSPGGRNHQRRGGGGGGGGGVQGNKDGGGDENDPIFRGKGKRRSRNNFVLCELFFEFLFPPEAKKGGEIDWAHIVEALNKLDAGVEEKILLKTIDDRLVVVATYRDIKAKFNEAFQLFFND